jgi:predicted nucleic acid-binding protein
MLLDTSGLLCYFDAGDSRHQEAVTFFQSAKTLLTHNYVLAEFIPLCHARGLNAAAALNFSLSLLSNPAVETIWIDETQHRAAYALLQKRGDKTYSLCDAISFP